MSSNVFRSTPLLSYNEIDEIFDSVLEELAEIGSELFSIDRVAAIIGCEMEENLNNSIHIAIYSMGK